MNDITLASKVLVSPNEAFTEIRDHPRFWFPLIIIVLATVAQLIWYYSVIDVEWLKDHLFSSNEGINAMAPEARARFMASMTRNSIMGSSVISVAVVLPLVFALISAYFLLAGKIAHVQFSYKQWFSLSAWSGLPTLIGLLASSAVLLTQGRNVQMGPSELQILSMNELFFNRSPADPGYQLLASISLITFWSWALNIVAVKTWSNRSWEFSATFVMLPYLAIYGIWALVAF